MPRPPKYATAKEAAEANLYSKMGGVKTGISQSHFIEHATSKCYICGSKPSESLTVNRSDGSYTLKWNYVTLYPPIFSTVCGYCKRLEVHGFTTGEIISHAARIMAKRMHDKRRKYKMKAQLEDMIDNWVK